MKNVKESAKYVLQWSRHVRIDIDAVRELADRIIPDSPQIPPWDYSHHYFDGTEKTLSYLFVLDTLNFCFWPAPGSERWTISYGGVELSGYVALAAALKRAFEQGLPLDDPSYLSTMNMSDLRDILQGKGTLQLMGERLQALRELGTYLVTKWKASPAQLLEACSGSAISLVHKLAANLQSFRDIAKYKGKTVYFYKRAQILAADIYAAFQGRGWGEFRDMDRLTAFADYKLPQVLRQLGVLVYSPELAARVDSMELIPPSSEEEIEIRAHTIWAVELLCSELKQKGQNICAFQMDWILWNMGQQDKFRKRPYHRTVTIFY